MSRRSAASGAANGTITAMLQLGGGAGSAKVVILYASVTGNTEEYAVALANTLKGCLPATVMNMEDFESDSWAGAIADAALVVIATSTYGPGAPPRAAAKFVQWLQGGGAGGGDDARECFKGGCALEPGTAWRIAARRPLSPSQPRSSCHA
jgi:sulfite reductase alpha subunit-like flavoprotein